MLDAFDTLRAHATSPELIVPGHDPLVMQRYPAVSRELRGHRGSGLDVAPAQWRNSHMNADELRAIQTPIKQSYRDDPATALVTARAEGSLDPQRHRHPDVDARHGKVTAGLHPAGGGTGKLACSADMLLEALVGCAGVTLRAVATAMGVTVRGGKVIAEGTWDARGTLGVDKTAPVGLTDITLTFDVDCDADPAKLERMVQTTERYCVILQTLKHPPKVDFKVA